MTQGTIRICGARQHNLQNLDLDIRHADPIPPMFPFNSPVGACEKL
jgi:excinuclease UvrABC ATPase subunit